MSRIHPTAQVDPGAVLGEDVEIGPFCVVGPDVRLGDRCRLIAHVVVDGHTALGEDNVVHPFTAIGLPPQSLKYKGGPTRLEMGARNVVREHVTMHTGTEEGGGVTRIGDGGLFMVGVHVAHDCRIGDGVVLVNDAALGGHVEIDDRAQIGGLSGIHQHVRIGTHAIVGGHSAVEKHVIPFGLAVGNRASLRGVNVVGLRRAGFSKDEVAEVQKAYGLLFSDEEALGQQLDRLVREFPDSPPVAKIIAFFRDDDGSPRIKRRGICQPRGDRA